MIAVIGAFVIHPDEDKKSSHHAYRQTGKVNNAGSPLFSDISPGDFKVVFPHGFSILNVRLTIRCLYFTIYFITWNASVRGKDLSGFETLAGLRFLLTPQAFHRICQSGFNSLKTYRY